MIAKEKAKELVGEYKSLWLIKVESNNFHKVDIEMNNELAKQCALIAVNEIIEQIKLLNHDSHFRTLNSYWQEVKQEIEKI